MKDVERDMIYFGSHCRGVEEGLAYNRGGTGEADKRGADDGVLGGWHSDFHTTLPIVLSVTRSRVNWPVP